MKKVFNASLLATAVAMSFGASATAVINATVDPVQLSVEGLAVGLNSVAAFDISTVIKVEHPASSEIVYTFGENVTLVGLTTTTCTLDTTAVGVAHCGDIDFAYGTGSFTFDNVVVDTTTPNAHTITFDVATGNPVFANSSFNMTVGNGNVPTVSGAATVAYASNLAGTEIETGSGVVAQEVAQYTATVGSELDGVIERTTRTYFATSADNTTTQVDVFTLGLSDIKADVVNPAFTNGTTIVLNHGLTDVTAQTAPFWVSAIGGAATAIDLVNGTVTFTYTEAQWVTGATAGLDTITFTKPANNVGLLETSDFSVDLDVVTDSLTAGAGVAGAKELISDVTAGDWALDAAVINVPYLPVGYGLSPNVEIANDSAVAVESEIILEGFDADGNVYGPVTLAITANGKTVTKISESDIETAFDLDADSTTKLSITFIIDADADKVSLAPYYKQNESRINVLSDQYKADSIR